MALLTREAITRKSAFEMVEVDVTEWGNIDPATGERERTTVFVRELSARERGELETAQLTKRGKPDINKMQERSRNFRARLAVLTCCDADGNPIFRPEDIPLLSEKPVKVLNRICDAALKLNNLTEDDIDEENTVKN